MTLKHTKNNLYHFNFYTIFKGLFYFILNSHSKKMKVKSVPNYQIIYIDES